MASVLTVSQLNKYLSFKLSSDSKLKGTAVRGEISNYNLNYRSGHAFFSLKDSESSISCVMFSSSASRLKFEPEDGMNVMVIGNVGVYERGGNCQIIVSEILPVGIGEIHRTIEKTKKELEASGIFSADRKKHIPLAPKRVAVITSLAGAALQDIIHITERRYPVCELLVFPAPVQGSDAHIHICDALRRADNSGADTLILARGGGSVEDLMPFNHRDVVLAVAECKTPVITAVGHETDTTLVDYAADLRAPTPSAAAELAVPDRAEMLGAVTLLEDKLRASVMKLITDKSDSTDILSLKLKGLSPVKRLDDISAETALLEQKLRSAVGAVLARSESSFVSAAASLEALSPFKVLGRGYSIVTRGDKAVLSANELSVGESVTIRFSDSEAEAEIKQLYIN